MPVRFIVKLALNNGKMVYFKQTYNINVYISYTEYYIRMRIYTNSEMYNKTNKLGNYARIDYKLNAIRYTLCGIYRGMGYSSRIST